MHSNSRWSRFVDWPPYVPTAQRRARATREVARRKKRGENLDPVLIAGRAIATTFWGKAWCDHMESYHDHENRLPRGRTYARNGSVIHLEIGAGEINALVSGTSLYRVSVRIPVLSTDDWQNVVQTCSGAIESMVELLAGRLATGVMNRLCRPDGGLFPGPHDLQMSCSCPDWATMCKHVAAVLYGVGARLDRNPETLFLLRGVSQDELVTRAVRAGTAHNPATAPQVDDGDLAAVFGIEIDGAEPSEQVRVQEPESPSQPESQPEPEPEVVTKSPVATTRRVAKPRTRAKKAEAVAAPVAAPVAIPKPPKPAAAKKPAKVIPPKQVSTAELLEKGIPLSTIQKWLDSELLLPTAKRRVYLTTAKFDEQLTKLSRGKSAK